MTARVLIKDRKAKPFWSGEVWVFDGSVDRVNGKRGLADGDVCLVCDFHGRPIGHGFWNSRSKIRVRIVSGPEREIDESLILERLDRAISLRHDVLGLGKETTTYRIVHAEGDGLPGLIVDRLGDYLVVEISVLGMQRYFDAILSRLSEKLRPTGIYRRVSHIARKDEGIESEDGVVSGTVPDGSVVCVEEGVKFLVDIKLGQKTGFYSDQRENRRVLAQWSKQKTVLDAFSYIGGFGLRALADGAAHVTLVDSSKPALEAAQKSAELNGLTAFECIGANVLRQLDHWRKEGRVFDVVSVDPPKLVPKAADLRRGLRLYHEINQKALLVTRDGGLLATSSCSQHVDERDFSRMVADAAMEASSKVQMLYAGGQGADHPLRVPHEESRYLKFRIYRVERDAIKRLPEGLERFRKEDSGEGTFNDEPETSDGGERRDR